MSWTDFVDDSIGSMPTNPTIANVFYRRGTMESWGRGISLIMQSCREQGLPEPRIEIVPNFVNLTIWFNELLSAQDSTRLHKSAQDCTSLHKSNLTETEQKIVDFCQVPRTIGEIAKMLGMNNKRWVREKYVAPLIGKMLTLTIPDKPNSRYQKYKAVEE